MTKAMLRRTGRRFLFNQDQQSISRPAAEERLRRAARERVRQWDAHVLRVRGGDGAQFEPTVSFHLAGGTTAGKSLLLWRQLVLSDGENSLAECLAAEPAPLGLTPELLRSALASIPLDGDRDTWVKRCLPLVPMRAAAGEPWSLQLITAADDHETEDAP